MNRFRFPIAAMISLVLMASFFSVLRALINVRSEAIEQAVLSKVEFVRLRRETEIEEKKVGRSVLDFVFGE